MTLPDVLTRDALSSAIALTEQKTEPDQLDQLESSRAYNDARTRSITEENLDRKANRRLRFQYARQVYLYLVWYSIIAALILVLEAFGPHIGFHLPELVLVTLVGSTGASAIGLVGFVVNGLFKGGA